MPCWDHAPFQALASLQVLFSYLRRPAGRASSLFGPFPLSGPGGLPLFGPLPLSGPGGLFLCSDRFHCPVQAGSSSVRTVSTVRSRRASDGTPLRGYPSHFASLAGPSRSRAAGGYAVRSPVPDRRRMILPPACFPSLPSLPSPSSPPSLPSPSFFLSLTSFPCRVA